MSTTMKKEPVASLNINGENLVFYNPNIFLVNLVMNLELGNCKGYKILNDDASLIKDADDMIYNNAGLKNPFGEDFYEWQIRQKKMHVASAILFAGDAGNETLYGRGNFTYGDFSKVMSAYESYDDGWESAGKAIGFSYVDFQGNTGNEILYISDIKCMIRLEEYPPEIQSIIKCLYKKIDTYLETRSYSDPKEIQKKILEKWNKAPSDKADHNLFDLNVQAAEGQLIALYEKLLWELTGAKIIHVDHVESFVPCESYRFQRTKPLNPTVLKNSEKIYTGNFRDFLDQISNEMFDLGFCTVEHAKEENGNVSGTFWFF